MQLYGHLPPISWTLQIRWTRHAGHCWRSKDELISDMFLWPPSHEQASVRQPVRTYLQQLCMDTGCLEDLPKAMDDSEGESGKSMLEARHDDDITVYILWYIYMGRQFDMPLKSINELTNKLKKKISILIIVGHWPSLFFFFFFSFFFSIILHFSFVSAMILVVHFILLYFSCK